MSSQGDVKQDACNKCNKKVFQPEKIIADDRLFHQSCFKCETCNIQLSTTNYSGSEGTYYCFKDFKAAQKEQNSQSDSKDSQIEGMFHNIFHADLQCNKRRNYIYDFSRTRNTSYSHVTQC